MSQKPREIFKFISLLLCFLLCFEQSGFAQAAAVELNFAGHLASLHQNIFSEKFRPLHLRYLSYDNLKNNFKLLLDKGDFAKGLIPKGAVSEEKLQEETKALLNYVFVGIALPNDAFWVNLRPDGEDNIIDESLAKTDVGKILLEADLQLKKDTAKFTSPETLEGKTYWDKLYKKAEELFGNENITIPTLTRPWIVPGEIIIRETGTSAYIYKASLKVMLEQDYLKDSALYSFKDPRLKALNEYSSQLIRELIIPKLTKEINTAKRYAYLRQVYYSLIIAQWFKQRFYGKGGLYSWRINKKDLTGITSQQSWSKTTYFQAYQKSFKDGEYNLKGPVYTPYGQTIRSYFSGGIALAGCLPLNLAPLKPGQSLTLNGGTLLVICTPNGELKIERRPALLALTYDKNGTVLSVPAPPAPLEPAPAAEQRAVGPARVAFFANDGNTVVDKTGQPIVMYRGISSDIDPYQFPTSRSSGGIFFTPDRGEAAEYAGKGGRVIASHLSILNPIPDKEADRLIETLRSRGLSYEEALQEFPSVALNLGYDGEWSGILGNAVVFSRKQVKVLSIADVSPTGEQIKPPAASSSVVSSAATPQGSVYYLRHTTQTAALNYLQSGPITIALAPGRFRTDLGMYKTEDLLSHFQDVLRPGQLLWLKAYRFLHPQAGYFIVSVREGGVKLQELRNHQTTVIGRDHVGEFAGVLGDNPGISRRHLVITRRETTFFLRDLDSSNGTMLILHSQVANRAQAEQENKAVEDVSREVARLGGIGFFRKPLPEIIRVLGIKEIAPTPELQKLFANLNTPACFYLSAADWNEVQRLKKELKYTAPEKVQQLYAYSPYIDGPGIYYCRAAADFLENNEGVVIDGTALYHEILEKVFSERGVVDEFASLSGNHHNCRIVEETLKFAYGLGGKELFNRDWQYLKRNMEGIIKVAEIGQEKADLINRFRARQMEILDRLKRQVLAGEDVSSGISASSSAAGNSQADKFNDYLKENGLENYLALKPLFTPATKKKLLEDAALRPDFMLMLPEDNVGPIRVVDAEGLQKIGGAEILEQHSIFLAGSPEVANKLAENGQTIVVGVTDRYSTDTMYPLHTVANGRQVYFPLPDGTWLGVKGAGQFLDETKPPHYWFADPNVPHHRGLVSGRELQRALEAKATLKNQDSRLVQIIGYRRLYALPDGKGNLVSTQELRDRDGAALDPVLIFNRVLSPHRLVKLPQLVKTDPGLAKLSRDVTQAMKAFGYLSAERTLSGSDLILMTMEELGRAEAAKVPGLHKRSIHAQDFIIGGQEADPEFFFYDEYVALGVDTSAMYWEDPGLIAQEKLGTAGILSKANTVFMMMRYLPIEEQRIILPSPFKALEALFKGYFSSLDSKYLRLWATEDQYRSLPTRRWWDMKIRAGMYSHNSSQSMLLQVLLKGIPREILKWAREEQRKRAELKEEQRDASSSIASHPLLKPEEILQIYTDYLAGQPEQQQIWKNAIAKVKRTIFTVKDDNEKVNAFLAKALGNLLYFQQLSTGDFESEQRADLRFYKEYPELQSIGWVSLYPEADFITFRVGNNFDSILKAIVKFSRQADDPSPSIRQEDRERSKKFTVALLKNLAHLDYQAVQQNNLPLDVIPEGKNLEAEGDFWDLGMGMFTALLLRGGLAGNRNYRFFDKSTAARAYVEEWINLLGLDRKDRSVQAIQRDILSDEMLQDFKDHKGKLAIVRLSNMSPYLSRQEKPKDWGRLLVESIAPKGKLIVESRHPIEVDADGFANEDMAQLIIGEILQGKAFLEEKINEEAFRKEMQQRGWDYAIGYYTYEDGEFHLGPAPESPDSSKFFYSAIVFTRVSVSASASTEQQLPIASALNTASSAAASTTGPAALDSPEEELMKGVFQRISSQLGFKAEKAEAVYGENSLSTFELARKPFSDNANGLALLRIGQVLFVDSELKDGVRTIISGQPEIKDNIIFIPGLHIEENTSLYVSHNAAIIAAIISLRNELIDKVVLDLGTGTGILGILALKLGAREVIGIDKYDVNGKVQAAVRDNSVRDNDLSGKFRVIKSNLVDFTGTLEKIGPVANDISIIFSNIGPSESYKGANIAAVGLLNYLKNVEMFISGGYAVSGDSTYNERVYSAADERLLASKGFITEDATEAEMMGFPLSRGLRAKAIVAIKEGSAAAAPAADETKEAASSSAASAPSDAASIRHDCGNAVGLITLKLYQVAMRLQMDAAVKPEEKIIRTKELEDLKSRIEEKWNAIMDNLRKGETSRQYAQNIPVALEEVLIDLSKAVSLIIANYQYAKIPPAEQGKYQATYLASLKQVGLGILSILKSDGTAEFYTGSPKEVFLYDVIDDCVRSREDIQITFTKSPGQPIVRIDRALLFNALTNIVKNAWEAGATSLDISVRIQGDDVVIVLRDNGPGIPLEILAKLNRGEAGVTTKVEPGDHGLGVGNVKRTIEAAGGTMAIESPNKGSQIGTTFTIALHLIEPFTASSSTEQQLPIALAPDTAPSADSVYNMFKGANIVVTVDKRNLPISSIAKFPWLKQFFVEMITRKAKKGQRVLTIGPGRWNLERELAKMGLEIYGIDPAQALLEDARSKTELQNAHLVLGKGEDLEKICAESPDFRQVIADGGFDIIIFSESIGHIKGPQDKEGDAPGKEGLAVAAQQAYKVLKPGGELYIMTYDQEAELHPMLNYRLDSSEEVKAALQKAGFILAVDRHVFDEIPVDKIEIFDDEYFSMLNSYFYVNCIKSLEAPPVAESSSASTENQPSEIRNWPQVALTGEWGTAINAAGVNYSLLLTYFDQILKAMENLDGYGIDYTKWRGKKMLEIGPGERRECLEFLDWLGVEVKGVDPATDDHPLVVREDAVKYLSGVFGVLDVIYSRNVLELHMDVTIARIKEMLQAANTALKDGGYLIMQVTDLRDTLPIKEFEQLGFKIISSDQASPRPILVLQKESVSADHAPADTSSTSSSSAVGDSVNTSRLAHLLSAREGTDDRDVIYELKTVFDLSRYILILTAALKNLTRNELIKQTREILTDYFITSFAQKDWTSKDVHRNYLNYEAWLRRHKVSKLLRDFSPEERILFEGIVMGAISDKDIISFRKQVPAVKPESHASQWCENAAPDIKQFLPEDKKPAQAAFIKSVGSRLIAVSMKQFPPSAAEAEEKKREIANAFVYGLAEAIKISAEADQQKDRDWRAGLENTRHHGRFSTEKEMMLKMTKLLLADEDFTRTVGAIWQACAEIYAEIKGVQARGRSPANFRLETAIYDKVQIIINLLRSSGTDKYDYYRDNWFITGNEDKGARTKKEAMLRDIQSVYDKTYECLRKLLSEEVDWAWLVADSSDGIGNASSAAAPAADKNQDVFSLVASASADESFLEVAAELNGKEKTAVAQYLRDITDLRRAIDACFVQGNISDAAKLLQTAIGTGILEIREEDARRWRIYFAKEAERNMANMERSDIEERFASGWLGSAAKWAADAIIKGKPGITGEDARRWINLCLAKDAGLAAGSLALAAIAKGLPGVTIQDVRRALDAEKNADFKGRLAVEAIMGGMPVAAEDVHSWINECFAQGKLNFRGELALAAIAKGLPGVTIQDVRNWIDEGQVDTASQREMVTAVKGISSIPDKKVRQRIEEHFAEGSGYRGVPGVAGEYALALAHRHKRRMPQGLSKVAHKAADFLSENGLTPIARNLSATRDTMGVDTREFIRRKDVLKKLADAFVKYNKSLPETRQYDQGLFERELIPLAYILELVLPGSIDELIGLLKASENPKVIIRFLETKKTALLDVGAIDALMSLRDRWREYRKKTTLENSRLFKIINFANGFTLTGNTKALIEELAVFDDFGNIPALYERLNKRFSTDLAKSLGIDDATVSPQAYDSLYLPFIDRLAQAKRDIEKLEPYKLPRFMGLAKAMLEHRFWDFIENEKQNDHTGLEIAEHNTRLKRLLQERGINVERWLGRNPQQRLPPAEFSFSQPDKPGKVFSVRPILRDPGHDLFIGDFTDCCLAMNSKEYPDAMVDRLIDEGMNVIEVIDQASGLTMAAAWLYIAEDGSLVIQNLEIDAKYEETKPLMYKVAEEMIAYAQKFAAHIGAKRPLVGIPGHGKYFITDGFINQKNYPTVPFKEEKIGGYLGDEKYYLDSAGKPYAYDVSLPSAVQPAAAPAETTSDVAEPAQGSFVDVQEVKDRLDRETTLPNEYKEFANEETGFIGAIHRGQFTNIIVAETFAGQGIDGDDVGALKKKIWQILDRYDRHTTLIVAGAVDLSGHDGSGIIYDVAQELGFKIAGIISWATLNEHPDRLRKLDFLHIKKGQAGDESKENVAIATEMLCFGGGPQAEAEIRMGIKAKNIHRVYFITGVGNAKSKPGAADTLDRNEIVMNMEKEKKKKTFVVMELNSGVEALSALDRKIAGKVATALGIQDGLLAPLVAKAGGTQISGRKTVKDDDLSYSELLVASDESRRLEWPFSVDFDLYSGLNRDQKITQYVEAPAQALVREILRSGGKPYKSNAWGEGFIGVWWRENGVKYFTPLVPEDYVGVLETPPAAEGKNASSSAADKMVVTPEEILAKSFPSAITGINVQRREGFTTIAARLLKTRTFFLTTSKALQSFTQTYPATVAISAKSYEEALGWVLYFASTADKDPQAKMFVEELARIAAQDVYSDGSLWQITRTLISSNQTKPYLDLASGVNFAYSMRGLQKGSEYIVTDTSLFVISYLTEVARLLGVTNVHIMRRDIRALTFDAGSLGTIRCHNMATYVQPSDQWWDAVSSWLGEGGQLIIQYEPTGAQRGEHTSLVSNLIQKLVLKEGWAFEFGPGHFWPGKEDPIFDTVILTKPISGIRVDSKNELEEYYSTMTSAAAPAPVSSAASSPTGDKSDFSPASLTDTQELGSFRLNGITEVTDPRLFTEAIKTPQLRSALGELIRMVPQANISQVEWALLIEPISTVDTRNHSWATRGFSIRFAKGIEQGMGWTMLEEVFGVFSIHIHPLRIVKKTDAAGNPQDVLRPFKDFLTPSFPEDADNLVGAIIAGSASIGYYLLNYNLQNYDNYAKYGALFDDIKRKQHPLEYLVEKGWGQLFKLELKDSEVAINPITYSEVLEVDRIIEGNRAKVLAELIPQTSAQQAPPAAEPAPPPAAGKPNVEDVLSDEKPSGLADRMLDKGIINRGDRILSLGSGNGNDELLFVQEGCEVLATDNNPEILVHLRQKARNLDNFEVGMLDLAKPFSELEDNSFDVVYTRLVLHYFGNTLQKQILNEIYRVLKPGGKAIIQVKTKKDWLYENEDYSQDNDGLVYFPNKGKDFKRNHLNRDELEDLLTSQEFSVTEAGESKERLYKDSYESSLVTVVSIKPEDPTPGKEGKTPPAAKNDKDNNKPGGPATPTGTSGPIKGEGPGGIDPSTSLRVKGGPGGIDFRGLPIVTQPTALGAGFLVSRPGLEISERLVRPGLEAASLDKEWLQIQKMLDAGITPSVQRIKEYLAACCEKSDFNQQIDKVLSCIADILRLEEDDCRATDADLRELLILLESGKPAQEIKLVLAKLEVSPGGAKLLVTK